MLFNFIPGIAQVKAAFRFLPYVGLAALALFAAIQWGNARHNKKLYVEEAKAHSSTIAKYEGAQAVASQVNKAQVAQIKTEYEKIAAKSENDYEIRLADNRNALDKWMRRQTIKRTAQSAGTSSPAEMPSETVPNAEEALVPVSDLEIAADNYSQLISLIEWAKSIGQVKTN
jgi:hypothetical protein